ncbi:MAG: diaminopimelate epimerase [Alphaproteobacteria bacterium]
MKQPFIKMHGIGNDFVILDGRKGAIRLSHEQIAILAARRTGIGCDQVIVMEKSAQADVFMRIYNPDSSEASSCGNATRCVAWLLMQESGKDTVSIQTRAGVMHAKKAANASICVDMGAPKFGWQDIPLSKESNTQKLDIVNGELKHPFAVSMGNPHIVFVVPDAKAVPLHVAGSILEHHPLFPERTNVSVAQVLDKNHVRLRVWERGAGETLACGTAACATLVALHSLGLVESAADIELPGGTLHISWNKATQRVFMTGDVAVSFTGVVVL